MAEIRKTYETHAACSSEQRKKNLKGFDHFVEATDAKNLGDAARGLVGLGRLSVPEKQPEMLRVWDGIKVDQQQRTVKITVAIPPDLIDKLIDLVGSEPRLHRLPVMSR